MRSYHSDPIALRMHDMLEDCIDQFEYYARNHREKSRAAMRLGDQIKALEADEKALVNEQFAERCRKAIGT